MQHSTARGARPAWGAEGLVGSDRWHQNHTTPATTMRTRFDLAAGREAATRTPTHAPALILRASVRKPWAMSDEMNAAMTPTSVRYLDASTTALVLVL